MNVLIDIEALAHPYSGIGLYTRHLIEGLSQQGLSLVSGYATLRYFLWRRLRSAAQKCSPTMTVAWIPLPGRFTARLGQRPRWSRFLVDPMCEAQLVHAPAFVAPAWWPPSKPTVLTIHDLAFLRYPNEGYGGHPTLATRLKPQAAQATAIITPSEFTRQDVIALLGIPPERIHVTPLAPQWGCPPDCSKSLPDHLIARGITPGHYFLAVGTVSPRKNYDGLLAAFSEHRRRYPDALLVVVGDYGWGMPSLRRDLGKMPGVLWLRQCRPDDLCRLYTHAMALMFLSHYEGFGMPAVEAMACGCPVCCFNHTAIAEVVGRAGLLIPPGDPAAVLDAMCKLRNQPELRDSLRHCGQERAKSFSWKTTVAKTIIAYQQALAAGADRSPSPRWRERREEQRSG